MVANQRGVSVSACFHVDLAFGCDYFGPPATNIRAIIMGIAATDCLQVVLQQNAISISMLPCFHVDLAFGCDYFGPPATNIRAIIMGIAATDCLQIVLQQNAIIC